MSPVELLKAISWAGDEAILNAQKPLRKKKHTWLIAAVIAALLVLAGCAAYVLSLHDLTLGSENIGSATEEDVRDLLFLQGFSDSPTFQAAKEWHEWKKEYDPDGKIFFSIDEFPEFPEAYNDYLLYTEEMREKVDALCEKYDLSLKGKTYLDGDMDAFFEKLHISEIFLPGTLEPDWEEQAAECYADGSFHIEFTVNLAEHPVMIGYSCNQKNTFSELALPASPVSEAHQEEFVGADGKSVLLAVWDNNRDLGTTGILAADRGDFFFSVDIFSQDESQVTLEMLETLAASLDFSIQPQSPGTEELAAGQQRYEQLKQRIAEEKEEQRKNLIREMGHVSYDARIQWVMSKDPDATELGYLLWDLDGNGVQELLIGKDGNLRYVFTQENDVAVEVFMAYANSSSLNYRIPQKGQPMGIGVPGGDPKTYLQEDGTIVTQFAGDSEIWLITHMEEGRMVPAQMIKPVSGDAARPWIHEGLLGGIREDKLLTQAEFDELIGTPALLDWTPIAEY